MTSDLSRLSEETKVSVLHLIRPRCARPPSPQGEGLKGLPMHGLPSRGRLYGKWPGSFATIVCVWRTFQFAEPSWGFVVFPLIIAVEVVVFRKWCHTLCPLGALMSLVGGSTGPSSPRVDAERCIHAKGGSCLACNAACPEGLSLHRHDSKRDDFAECTRCGECADACPAQAIAFRLRKAAAEAGKALKSPNADGHRPPSPLRLDESARPRECP